MEGYALPPDFFEAAVGDFKTLKDDLNGKQTSLSLGRNILHKWNLPDALSALQLGPFQEIISNTDLTLLANEQPEGMLFSMLFDVSGGKEFLNVGEKKIIDLNWACFSLAYPFSDSEAGFTDAIVSANVTLFGQKEASATLEASFSPKNGENNDWQTGLAIYPDKAFDLEGGISELFSLLDLGDVSSEIPLPAPNFVVHYLKLDISKQGIESVSVDLGLAAGSDDKGWEVIPQLFTLYGISLTLDWQKGAGIRFQTNGAMNALSYDFLLSYAYPAQVIKAQLAPDITTSKSIESLAKEVEFPQEISPLPRSYPPVGH